MCGTTGRREIAYLHEGKDRIDDIIMHAQSWANKIKNRTGKIENRSRTEPNRTREFDSSSVLGSLEPKYSVRFRFLDRLTEKPTSF